jgi:hypothetical protein
MIVKTHGESCSVLIESLVWSGLSFICQLVFRLQLAARSSSFGSKSFLCAAGLGGAGAHRLRRLPLFGIEVSSS